MTVALRFPSTLEDTPTRAPPTGLRSESAVQDPCCFPGEPGCCLLPPHSQPLGLRFCLPLLLMPFSPLELETRSLHPNLSIHTAGALCPVVAESPPSESDCSQFSDQHSAIILDPQSSLPVLSGRSSSGSIPVIHTPLPDLLLFHQWLQTATLRPGIL